MCNYCGEFIYPFISRLIIMCNYCGEFIYPFISRLIYSFIITYGLILILFLVYAYNPNRSDTSL